MLRTLLFGALCVVLMGADCGGYEPGLLNPTSCPPPTIAECQTPVTACDNHFHYLGKTDPDSPCSLLLSQAAVSAAHGYPQKTVLKPKTYSGIKAFPPDAGTALVHAVPEDSDITATGLAGFGFGRRTLLASKIRSSDAVLAIGARLEMSDRVAGYEANGDQVASCEEYEFEKFFDLTAWDAQVLIANATSNHRKAFDLAYATDGARTAVGTLHLVDPVLRARDGSPSGVTVPFEFQHPKNDYFRVPYGQGSGAKILFLKSTVDEVVTDGPLGMVVKMKDLARGTLALHGVVFDDPTLLPVIQGGQAFYEESFRWHRDMATRNAGVLDEQLLLEHELRDQFLGLIAQRDEVVRQIAEYGSGGKEPIVEGSNRYATRWWLDNRWNPDPTAVGAINGLTSQAVKAPGFALDSQQTFVTYSYQASPAKETLSPAALATMKINSNLQAPCNGTGNPFFCLVYRLAAIDQALEDALLAAKARGCLALNATGPAPCDWSPRDFTQRLQGFADAAREKAFRQCDESVDSFVDLKSRALVQDRADGGVGVNYPTQDYTVNTTAVDRYFVRQDQYLDVLGEVLGPLLERKLVNGTNKLRLARTEGDQHQLGDKWFGANLHYSLGFEMDGLPAMPVPPDAPLDDCVIKTRADATFGLTATILTADIDLVSATVHAQDERFEAHVQVLTQAWDETLKLDNGTVPVFTDSQMAYQTFLEGHSTFAIGYILISIGAGVSGGVGYGVEVKVGRETIESNGCQVSRLGVYPTIVPLTFVEGSAYAALEAVVARAGIKGYLTLASVSVPIAGEVSIGPTMNDPTILDARFKLGATLKLHFFGGRIAVFVEVGICPLCASFEGDLVSWEGLKKDIPLFEYALTVRLGDLKRIAKQQGVLTPVTP